MGETAMRLRRVMSRIFKGVNRFTSLGCRAARWRSNFGCTFIKLNLSWCNYFLTKTILLYEEVEPRRAMKTFASAGVVLLGMTVMAVAEPQTTAPQPTVNVQINTEFLNDLMRSAMIFNGMVQNLNLNKTLHDSGVTSDNTKHTAAVLGAGAGVGLAVGGMTGSQKGALIGAVAGTAGAFVIDQIVQHQQAAKAPLANQDNSQQYPYNEREPQHFKERPAQQQ